MGPSGRFPIFIARTAALRLPTAPLRFARRSARRSSSCNDRTSDLPSSWTALANAPCSKTPAGWAPMPVRENLPTIGRFTVAFRGHDRIGHRNVHVIEAHSHGSQARCLRFAAEVALVHARLASGWRHPLARRDRSTSGPAPGSYEKFPSLDFPFPQASLGAPRLRVFL